MDAASAIARFLCAPLAVYHLEKDISSDLALVSYGIDPFDEKWQSWKLESLLGRGGFGTAYIGQDGHVIKIASHGNHVDLEARLLQMFDSLELPSDKDRWFLPMYIADTKSSTHDFLKSLPIGLTLPVYIYLTCTSTTEVCSVVRTVGCRLVDMFCFLHNHFIFHGDMRQQNVIIVFPGVMELATEVSTLTPPTAREKIPDISECDVVAIDWGLGAMETNKEVTCDRHGGFSHLPPEAQALANPQELMSQRRLLPCPVLDRRHDLYMLLSTVADILVPTHGLIVGTYSAATRTVFPDIDTLLTFPEGLTNRRLISLWYNAIKTAIINACDHFHHSSLPSKHDCK